MRGREVRKGLAAPAVLPEGKEDPLDTYQFFYAYFLCGLSPPFSDFTPNAMACKAIFTHLCENFIGVAPNVDLFRHFFVLRVENKTHRSANISWIPRGKRYVWDYLCGHHCNGWEEWRVHWCWNQDPDAPKHCRAWTECVVHDNDWGEPGLTDDRIRPALNMVARLNAVGLTIEYVRDDFLRRCISPLQKRDRFARWCGD